jgi:two-component system sensor histidine kinase/response regulator
MYLINADVIEIKNRCFSMARVAQAALHIITPQAEKKGLALHMHVSSAIPAQCVGDPVRIGQILVNLLSNAVKYTERGHVAFHVNLETDKYQNEQINITVIDTGIGIEESEVERISVRRDYGDPKSKIALSQKIARLMHGNITIKSWPGVGSYFTVTLPLHRANEFLVAA